MSDVDWISLGNHIWVTISSIILLGTVSRADAEWHQSRIKYCVSAAVISVVFSGLFAIPLEFLSLRIKRWTILILDHLQWMLLFAAAVILSDDIKTFSKRSRQHRVSRETVRVVKTATAFAWVSLFFIFINAIYDIYLVRGSEIIHRGRPRASPLSGSYGAGHYPTSAQPAQAYAPRGESNLEPEISPISRKLQES